MTIYKYEKLARQFIEEKVIGKNSDEPHFGFGRDLISKYILEFAISLDKEKEEPIKNDVCLGCDKCRGWREEPQEPKKIKQIEDHIGKNWMNEFSIGEIVYKVKEIVDYLNSNPNR